LNPLSGYGPTNLVHNLAAVSTSSEFTFSQAFGAGYKADVAITATFFGGIVKSYTFSLTETIPLVEVKPASAIIFPDVKTKAVALTYSGSKKAIRVAGVTPARLESIKWLAGFGVTAGSGVDAKTKKITFRPQDTVNRGAMAQFLQKLAGFTDEMIAAKYRNAATKLTDISQFKTSNPARYYAILWLADTKITVGCNASGTKFCPANPVNRGAMAEFMQKFAGLGNIPTGISSFPDVSTKAITMIYHGSQKSIRIPALNKSRIAAINWLAKTGITVGSGFYFGKPTFKPQDPVTRGAMAQFMHKLAYQLGATSVQPN
jgi:hypothetical protein